MGAPKGKGKGSKGKGKGSKGTTGKGDGKGKAAGTGDGKGKDVGKGVSRGMSKGKSAGTPTAKWVKMKGTVLVTGASGYLAMSVIRRLLDKQYKVKGTVRSLEGQSAKELKQLFPNLILCEADLLGHQEAFEKAMDGCNCVMHTASPFQLSVKDPQKDLVDPALQGTEKVVFAAIKMGISRVVLTSSVAAVGPPMSWRSDVNNCVEGKVFSDADWNEEASLANGPYLYSKVVAEKKAWELADGKEGFSLSVICPSFILGPMMTSRTDGESVKFIKSMLEGTVALKGFPSGVVDVRDVSLAHIVAMETPEAGGKRFLCTSSEGQHRLKMADMIRDRFKAYPIPKDGEIFGYTPKFNVEQSKQILKFDPRPVEISLRDMASAAIRTGVVAKKFVLKQTKFGTVARLTPASKGVNLIVRVVSTKDTTELKSGTRVQEVVAGDGTAVVTFRLVGDELEVVDIGKIIEIRNAAVKIFNGFIRVSVGKWGKVSKHEGDTEMIPNKQTDVSAVEYELVEH